MSVINKMLQDLDARESSSSAINADYQPPQNKSKSVLWLVLILVLLVSLVAGFFILSHGLEQNTHQDMAVKSTIDEEIVNSATATTQIDSPQEQPSSVAKVQQNMVVEAETIMVAEENTQSKTDSNHLVDSSNADSPMSLISSAEQKESRQSDDVIQTTNDQSDSTDNQSALGRVEEVKSQPEASFSMSSTSLMAHKKDLKQRIAEQLDAGNQAQGIVLLEQFLVEQPNNINARKKLASLYFAQGRQEQAKLLLSQSVEQYPQRSDFRLMLARILVLEQQQTQAMQWLEELPTTQSNAELLAYRAVLAQQLRKTDLAKQDYAALTRIDPDNGKWWLGLGIAEDKLGNPKQALVAYQSANQTNQLDAVVADFVKTRIDILSESK